MGMRVMVMLLAALAAEEPSVELELAGSLKGAILYNYVAPYLYLMNYEFYNPAVAHGMNGAIVNPAGLATVQNAAGVVTAGFGRRGKLEQTVALELPVVGYVDIPLSLYAAEASGVNYGGAALRISDLVLGVAYREGRRIQSEIVSRGEFTFQTDYTFSDTVSDPGIPGSEGDIPIYLKIDGKAGGIFTLDRRMRLRTTPFYLFFATELENFNLGVAFRWNNIRGWIDYTDSALLRLDPTTAEVYTESDDWKLDITTRVDIAEEPRFNSYYTTLRGDELGAMIGVQKNGGLLRWGASLGLDLGANLLREREGYEQRVGFPYLAELNASNLVIDEEAKTMSGTISAILKYDDLSKVDMDTSDILVLPPRTNLCAGIQVHPGDWIIDASLNLVKTWGKGTSEIFFGTGFGYDWKVPIRFSQGLYYSVTQIEEIPIYSIPAIFFGVSSTLNWKAIQLDLSIRANTTTALFTNTLAEIDPDIPNLGMLNYLSAGAALSYEF
ncbi:hypothetical protein JXM67_02430 [candidate division WOR-3 bacterium]|nr:hypothetical protein [candidate division WOR-3 bacterium]